MASVKVALRVRPFDNREKQLDCKCIVEIQDKTTRLLPASYKDHHDIKIFTFDSCYWSHNKEDSNFASQEYVYNDLGAAVVENVLQGYNACVFAYGQTGSGKTYTMMGSKDDLGLIPRICEALFQNVDEGRKSGTTYRVEANYLEIYNEKVKDLLSPSNNKNGKLKVRENKLTGPFVENLSKHEVNTFGEINRLMGLGNNCRTTASTKMNDTSSRSHAIFTITFTQARIENDLPQETISKIHLVDLAGSERASSTGASGIRLNEGSHINKSLVTLGQVIQGLADSASKKMFCHIPYRDSTLTWLLKDSLGGNSKTVMIATISPAEVNFGESLSTLRYASRAKSIINKPKVNEDPHVRQIKTLKEEINRLKSEIEQQKINDSENCFADEGILEKLNSKQAQKMELTTMWTEKWKQTRKILQEQKALGLKMTGESGHGVTLYSDQPHVVVMGTKGYSSGATVFTLQIGINSVGSATGQDIPIEGIEILDTHCTIERNNEGSFLKPATGAAIYLGNELIQRPLKLRHGYMLLLGDNNVLKYNDPEEAPLVIESEKKDCFFNKSLRNSFLSRSNLDLYKSSDDLHLSRESSFMGKKVQDSMNLSLKKSDVTNVCEMATQTSINSGISNLTTSIVNKSTLPNKLEMSLSLEESSENVDDLLLSTNSTPASDTFYTATSILTPDPNEILSPLPIDEMCPSADRMNSTPENDEGLNIELANLLTSPIHLVPQLQHLKYLDSDSFNTCGGAATSTPIRVNEDAASESSVGPSTDEGLCTSIPSDDQSNSLNKFSEKSELLSLGDGIGKLLDVANRLESLDSNRSLQAQQKELNNFKEIYANLEERLLKEDEQNENWKKRPSDLPGLTEIEILKEGRVALLIEREVNRRVLERFSSLENEFDSRRRRNTNASLTSLPDRMMNSVSPDTLHRNLNLPIDPFRPHSSMSTSNYDLIMRGSFLPSVSSQQAAIASSPSASSDYDMTCGFCVTIPGYQLKGTGSFAHWEYEVQLTAGIDSWTIYRRYRRFRELHMYMCHKYGLPIQELYFPPRRIFGNNTQKVIEQRRTHLQLYLQQLIVLCTDMQISPLCDVQPSRQILTSFSQFFEKGIFEAGKYASS